MCMNHHSAVRMPTSWIQYSCNCAWDQPSQLFLFQAHVPPARVSHIVRVSCALQARRYAESLENAVWTNQFDNTANRRAHFETTGPEIWAQTGHHDNETQTYNVHGCSVYVYILALLNFLAIVIV